MLQDVWRNISTGAFLLMILISGISLVVGAIVIANIMFVSVVERTMEICLRMTLGARRPDVRRQFLLVLAALSAIRGTIRGSCGGLGGPAVSQIFPSEVRHP